LDVCVFISLSVFFLFRNLLLFMMSTNGLHYFICVSVMIARPCIIFFNGVVYYEYY
jgi:hypothetical protein